MPEDVRSPRGHRHQGSPGSGPLQRTRWDPKPVLTHPSLLGVLSLPRVGAWTSAHQSQATTMGSRYFRGACSEHTDSAAPAPLCSCLVDLESLCSPQTTSVGGLGEHRHPDKTKRWIFPKPLERDGRVPGPGRFLWPGENLQPALRLVL